MASRGGVPRHRLRLQEPHLLRLLRRQVALSIRVACAAAARNTGSGLSAYSRKQTSVNLIACSSPHAIALSMSSSLVPTLTSSKRDRSERVPKVAYIAAAVCHAYASAV